MLKFLVLPLTLLALCSCQKGPTLGPGDDNVLASAGQESCGFVRDTYGYRVSWKNNIPVRLKIHKSFPSDFKNALVAAASHWNEAAGLTLFLFEDAGSELTASAASKDNKNTIYWHNEWPHKNKNFQGLTSLYWKSRAIYEADIAINNQTFSYFTGPTPISINEVHLESLLVHELGHVLGLDHRQDIPTVMYPILNSAVIRDTLQKADRDAIKCEY